MKRDPETNRPLPSFAPGDPVVPLDLPGTVCRVIEVHREAMPCGAYGGPQWLPISYIVELPDGTRTYYSEGFLSAPVVPVVAVPALGRVMTPHGPGTVVGPAPALWPAGSLRIRLDATMEIEPDGAEKWHGGFERLYTAGEILR